jgi:hypothetical protein
MDALNDFHVHELRFMAFAFVLLDSQTIIRA